MQQNVKAAEWNIFNCWRTLKGASYDDFALYREARKYSREFTPIDDGEYKWVYEYALLEHNRIVDDVSRLDTKAENLIKFLTPLASLITFASVLFSKYATNAEAIVLGIIGIGIIFLIGGVICSLFVLRPIEQTCMPPVKNALDYANFYEKTNPSFGKLASVFEMTAVGQGIVARKKELCLSCAFWAYAIGLLLITVPPVAWAIMNPSCLRSSSLCLYLVQAV